MPSIPDFIDLLANCKTDPLCVENLYSGNSLKSDVRRHNLLLYLEKMKALSPDVILVGEAPGYKGCALTGIPFTSENVLAKNEFFQGENYKFIDKVRREKESSATIVWGELAKYDNKPLIWNIFPFHPFEKDNLIEKDNTKSNRPPTSDELRQGFEILEKLLKLFDIKKIVAVGKKAESQIKNNKYYYAAIRHPANGGKNDFAEGLKRILTSN
ncbi:MAG TPA: uracil-DNA glycosylase [bacterium]|nr:uracil-DNA glycosylase [bacterium]